MTTPRFIIRRATGDALRPWYLIDTQKDPQPFFRRGTHAACIKTAEAMRYMENRGKSYPGAIYSDRIYPTPDGYGLILEDLHTPPKHIYQRTSTVLTPAHPEELTVHLSSNRTGRMAVTLPDMQQGTEEDPAIARVKKQLEENHADDARYNYLREKAIKRSRSAHALKIDPAMYSDNADYQRTQQETLEHRRAPDTHTRKFFLRLWRALTS